MFPLSPLPHGIFDPTSSRPFQRFFPARRCPPIFFLFFYYWRNLLLSLCQLNDIWVVQPFFFSRIPTCFPHDLLSFFHTAAPTGGWFSSTRAFLVVLSSSGTASVLPYCCPDPELLVTCLRTLICRPCLIPPYPPFPRPLLFPVYCMVKGASGPWMRYRDFRTTSPLPSTFTSIMSICRLCVEFCLAHSFRGSLCSSHRPLGLLHQTLLLDREQARFYRRFFGSSPQRQLVGVLPCPRFLFEKIVRRAPPCNDFRPICPQFAAPASV